MDEDRKNIRRFCRKPSKPQLAYFEEIKKIYPTAQLEYPVKISNSMTVWLDIAIPELKLDFELDGEYWHNKEGVKEKDELRDKLLKEDKWKITRKIYKK